MLFRSVSKETYENFIKLLAPLAPHLSEELWGSLGNKQSIFNESWPTHDSKKVVDAMVTVAVQINGKVRGTVQVAPDAKKKDVEKIALKEINIDKYLEGKDVKEVVYVPGRIINFVLK